MTAENMKQAEGASSEESRQKFAASNKNSTGNIGRATNQSGYQLACTEVWGGNNIIAGELVKLPGMAAFIHSRPVERGTTGGECRRSATDRGVHLISVFLHFFPNAYARRTRPGGVSTGVE